MPTPSTKKKVKKIAAEDPLSSSGVSSLSGISSYNIRKISIYKNGDRYHRGVKFVINPRVVKDMEPLLNQINDRIELSHGAKKLYTTDGKVVGSIKELEDGKIYVAASSHFIPMRYGEFAEKVWKPPSRKHSPIMSSDRIKTARTRSQDPGRRRQPQNSGVSNASQNTGSGVQRSRSVRTLAEDRKSRRDNSNAARNVNGNVSQVPKKFDQPRPKAPGPKPSLPKPRRTLPASTATTKIPPTPKRKISKKVLGAAAGVGVTVVGAAALGAVAAASKKGKPATPKPKPIPTAASDISTSSVIPSPNVETSGAAEILEFPEEEKKIDVAMIHRTPTPPHIQSRSASAKSAKRAGTPADRSAKVLEAKSVSQQPTPEESSEDEGHEEDDEDEDVEDDEEEAGSEEVEEPSDEEEGSEEGEDEDEEEDEEEEEEGEEEESRAATPASRKSSSAVSSAGSHHDDKKEKKEAKK